jgi:predicted permease
MNVLLQDIRYALRQMRKSPWFTAIVILTLALGIGANTALFTVVNAVLLKPLPVRNPNELVLMVWDSPNHDVPIRGGYDGTATSDFSTTGHLQGTSFPYLTFQRMQQAKDVFSDVFAFASGAQLNFIADGRAELAAGQVVSGGYYEGLGVRAWRGRMLTAADDASGAPPAAVITWQYWQRRFAGDSAVVGKTVTINNVRFTIVGISPPDFTAAMRLDEAADFTLPLATEPLLGPQNPGMKKPELWWLRIMARLQPGVTRRKAQARMDPVFQQSVVDSWNAAKEKPKGASEFAPSEYPRLFVTSGAQGDGFSRRQYRQPLIILMSVVGMVLLIACTNVANLLLAKSSGRREEFAMRMALGATSSRLMRQILTECLLLSAIAGIAGCLLAVWGKELLLRWTQWIRGGVPLQANLDLRVLSFTIAISVLTGLLFGLVPALRAGRSSLAPMLKTQVGGGRRTLTSRLMIMTQVAVSLVLLVGAGLFVRTLRNLNSVNAGFDQSNLLLFRVNPEANGYTEKASGPLYDQVIQHLSSIPGVESASLSRHPLLNSTHLALAVYLSPKSQHNGEIADVNIVSPSFFTTMDIPILVGRALKLSDTAASGPVVVVNQEFVQQYFLGENPIGQRFWLGDGGEGTGWPLRKHMTAPPKDPPLEIVGVSRDAKYTDLRTKIYPTVYQSYTQEPTGVANFEVRYRGNESEIVNAVREAVRQVDPRLPIFDLRTQTEQSAESLAEERTFANLASSMGALTLLLAAVGLFGIMSYSVGQRTAEIGVRMALGAQQRGVLMMVLRETLALVVAGIALGLPLAFASARAASSVLSDLLFGIKPTDPLSFGLAIVAMVVIAVLAGYVPARRAAKVDPMTALRCE